MPKHLRPWSALLLASAMMSAVSAAPRPRPLAARPAAKVQPKDATKLLELGIQQVSREEYDAAIETFERSFQASRDPIALYNIAQCHRKAGRPASAVDAYDQFLRSAPRDHPQRAAAERSLTDARYSVTEERAGKLFSDKQYQEAAALYEAAYKLKPVPNLLLRAAAAQRLADRPEEAAGLYERALRASLTPAQKDEADRGFGEARAHVADQQARKQSELKLYAEAARTWLVAYKYRPSPELLYNAAHAQKRAGQHTDALRTFERYLDEDAQTPRRAEVEATQVELRALMKDERAQQLAERGKLAEAVQAWGEAYQVKPLPAFVYRQARALRLLGKSKESLQKYEQYLLEDKEPPPGRRLEAETAARELRGMFAAQREAEEVKRSAARPPVHRRPWFVALVTGLGVAVAGGAVALGVVLRPQPPAPPAPADVSGVMVTF